MLPCFMYVGTCNIEHFEVATTSSERNEASAHRLSPENVVDAWYTGHLVAFLR